MIDGRTVTCGIYSIQSTKKMYIGSSSDISKRWNAHRHALRKGIHHNPHLQNAWNKHGEEAFEFIVLEECPADQLLDREQFHLDRCPDKYNCSPLSGSRRGIPHSPETKAKISASNMGHTVSDVTRAKISASKRGHKSGVGRVHSPETRAKISASLTGKRLSDETRAKMSASAKRRSHKNELPKTSLGHATC